MFKKKVFLIIVVIGVFVVTILVSMVAFASEREYRSQDSRKGSGSSSHKGPGGDHDSFSGPREGERAPDFTLQTLDGQTMRLSDYVGKRPIALEFGSYTCPVFRKKHPSMEKLYRRYGDGPVLFLVIYAVEAHPKGDPSPYSGEEWVTGPNKKSGILFRQPTNKAQRKELAKKAQSALDINITMLIDDMQNSTWKAYGQAPNAAYIIGVDGRIKLRQGWFEPVKFEPRPPRSARPSGRPAGTTAGLGCPRAHVCGG